MEDVTTGAEGTCTCVLTATGIAGKIAPNRSVKGRLHQECGQ
jgi:hypothetical protein